MNWSAAFDITASVFIVYGIYAVILTFLSFLCKNNSFRVAVPADGMDRDEIGVRLRLGRIYAVLDASFAPEPVLLFPDSDQAQAWLKSANDSERSVKTFIRNEIK